MTSIRIYTQMPGFSHYVDSPSYTRALVEISRRADECGIEGSLVFFNHAVLDPWAVSSVVLQNTRRHVPLVALQPYMYPPHTAAKMIHSLSYLYNRRIDINMITGAVTKELHEVGDNSDHRRRYDRLQEYVVVLKALLESPDPVSFQGDYYSLSKVDFSPKLLAKELLPKIFIAGSSEQGMQAALAVGDIAVTHPGPIDHYQNKYGAIANKGKLELAIRIELIARPTSKEAWCVAHARYPVTRQGDIQLVLKMKSESQWQRDLAELAIKDEQYDDVFWMGGFRNGGCYSPVLVGSYGQVAQYLQQYFRLGVKSLLLSSVYEEEEFIHLHALKKWIDGFSTLKPVTIS
ncbi:LLM class flavin-dependent oxidoreductase [Paenibacillus sp. KS-LC4]|uniref:LLM class flavin-dependent oxidoreductase n=1 Tax=Paenibacillus sp. KS-LC4 TaxID=2979727 RepID=UPI0030CD10D8